MKIGAFSRASGISIRMLRFYEAADIITPARTAGGYREYAERDVSFVRKAAMLNRAGLALKDIALLRDCLHDEPQDFCAELRGRLHAARAAALDEIERLRQSELLIAALLGDGENGKGTEAV